MGFFGVDRHATLIVTFLLLSFLPKSSAQSSVVCPDGGVSIGVLVGACFAVFAGTLLFELLGYLAYQKWRKKRSKINAEGPRIAYCPSETINIEPDVAKTPSKDEKVKDTPEAVESDKRSLRSSVFNISETQDSTSFFESSDHDSRSNSIIDIANDFEPLKDTYRIDWKASTESLDLADDYDVLEKAFPILLPKLDAIDFTSARYKSSEIHLIPEPQNLIVGVVKGDKQSTTTRTSSTRTYRTTSYGATSLASPIARDDHRRRQRYSPEGERYSDSAVVEIVPDRPSNSRDARIEIDENFSIASSRKSESSDEDLYDHGDVGKRVSKSEFGHPTRQSTGHGQQLVKIEKREVLRRRAMEKQHSRLDGSAAMKASGAQRAKSLGAGGSSGRRYVQHSTHLSSRGKEASKLSGGHDYQVAKREIIDGKEFVTLVREDESTSLRPRDYASLKATQYQGRSRVTLPRSFSESEVDPRSRVSFREPLESVSDENSSVPTIGVIHLVDSNDGSASSDTDPRRYAGAKTTRTGRPSDRYQKRKGIQRSRSQPPSKHSERSQSEERLSESLISQDVSRFKEESHGVHRTRSATLSDVENQLIRNSSSSMDIPTVGVVRLVSPGAHSHQNTQRTVPKRSASVEIHPTPHDENRPARLTKSRSAFLRTVDVSTQCNGPQTKTSSTQPRVPWEELLRQMEEILTNEMKVTKEGEKTTKRRSTLSRLTGSRKGKKDGKSTPELPGKTKSRESVYDDSDGHSWNELLQGVQDERERMYLKATEKYPSETESSSFREFRSSSAQSRGSASFHTDTSVARSQTLPPSSRSDITLNRERSLSPDRRASPSARSRIRMKNKSTEPEMTWPNLVEAVKKLVREEEGGRGRPSLRRSDRDALLRLVNKGTQPEVSWGTLLRLTEARIEERLTNEQKSRKRSAPLVGKFSLKTEKVAKARVADMGTSPDLSWGDFIEIATAEAERNLKSKSVPDLRVSGGPQNIGVFALKETREESAPRRNTGTETDLSFTDLVDIILEEIELIGRKRSASESTISRERERLVERAKSLGIYQLRSQSEERPRGRDSSTQSELSWAQLIDIVENETRKMILQQRQDSLSEMGTDPVISWIDLVETILEESDEYWRRKKKQSNVERSTEPDLSWGQLVSIIQEESLYASRKSTKNKGVQPSWGWAEIVSVIQEETEEILRLRALSNMDSKAVAVDLSPSSNVQGTQTENDSNSVAVSTLRTWVRDRPRRVQWEEATEPETEWSRLVREIEDAAIKDYIQANGLDQPREAPVVSVFKLKKDSDMKKKKKNMTDSGTDPVINWHSYVTEIQEEAIESFKKVQNQGKREPEVTQRSPVFGVFKLKQEDKPEVVKHDSGTNPDHSWNDIVEDIETSAIESYRRTRTSERPTNIGVYKIKGSPIVEKEENCTQSEEGWSEILAELREEFENEYRRTIRELESKLNDLEDTPKSLGVLTLKGPQGPKLIDRGTQPQWTWDVLVNRVQEETEETLVRRARTQRQKQLDSMLTTSVQVDIETVDAGIGDDVISNEDDFVDVRDASTQVDVRMRSQFTETIQRVSECSVQVQAKTTENGVLVSQQMKDTGSDAVVIHLQSVGVTCTPGVTDAHTSAEEAKIEMNSIGTQAAPSRTAFGTTTMAPQMDSKSLQCKPEVSAIAVTVKQDLLNQTQQTIVEKSHCGMMTEPIIKELQNQELQVAADQLTQSSQTEIVTYESSCMTDPVAEREEVQVTVTEEREELANASPTVEKVGQELQATPDTYETWTYTDVVKYNDQESEVYFTEFTDLEEKEPVMTSIFGQQFGKADTTERCVVALPETKWSATETEVVNTETKESQASPDCSSQNLMATPQTSLISTQTTVAEYNNVSVSCVPSMVAKDQQSAQEMSLFAQNTETTKIDIECQAIPQQKDYHNEATEVKPDTKFLATECYEEESDAESGIEMDCQTQPVMIFSFDEYQHIEREIHEYKKMQRDMEELQERLKEFEEMAELRDREEYTDIGIETDLPVMESETTQTSKMFVSSESSQTEASLNDRSTSPKRLEIRHILSQTMAAETKDCATDVEEVIGSNQGTQVLPEARNFGTITEETEIISVTTQTNVSSKDSTSQYDYSEEEVGIQADMRVENVNQASQVSVSTKLCGTSTDVSEVCEMSTQSSVMSRDNNSQYETNETDTSTQTVSTVSTKLCGTSTDVSEVCEMSTQSSVMLRDNNSQYDANETEAGTQTAMKQATDASTETQEEVVEEIPMQTACTNTETLELKHASVVTQSFSSSSVLTQTEVETKDTITQSERNDESVTTQTDSVVLKDVRLDPIAPSVTEAEVQAEQPTVDLLYKVTQTEQTQFESSLVQTEELIRDVKDATTSPHIDSAEFGVQTTRAKLETTSSQYVSEAFSALTQTDKEDQIEMIESGTSMDLVYSSFSGQTETVPQDSRGIQYEVDANHVESQTEVKVLSDVSSNTANIELYESSVQTQDVEIIVHDTQVQHSPEVEEGSSQTLHIAMKDSSSVTDAKESTDKNVGTKEVTLSNIASQVTTEMRSEPSQCEVEVQAHEAQTELVETNDACTSSLPPVALSENFTQYDIATGVQVETQTVDVSRNDASTSSVVLIQSDSCTQYESASENQQVQTVEVPVVSSMTSTDQIVRTTVVTQTDIEAAKKVDHEETQTIVENHDFGVTVKIENEIEEFGVQINPDSNEQGVSCDFKNVEYVPVEKKVETQEASILKVQSTSLFQAQFTQPPTPQEDVGTTFKPPSTMAENQFYPETAIFEATATPSTTETGTLVERQAQREISSQMSPVLDEKSTEIISDTMQRSLSPMQVAMVNSSTQITLKPVHTSTLQIQVNEIVEQLGEDTVRVIDAYTQTHSSTVDSVTQTSQESTTTNVVTPVVLAETKVTQRRQTATVFQPVQFSRGTSTYNSIKKDMGTQYVTREFERRSVQRKNVVVTSEGTLTDMTTQTTQTVRTQMVNSGVQHIPPMTSVGVYPKVQQITEKGVDTQLMPRQVKDVPIQKDEPEKKVEEMILRHVEPETTRSIPPHIMATIENQLISKMKSELRSQVKKEVEEEYKNEVLPALVEQALQDIRTRVERSRPASRDAVTSPLRGRSVERSFQHSESWPFSSTEAPEKSHLNEKELNILRENTRRELKTEMRPEVRKEIEIEVRKEVTSDIKDSVIREMKNDMRESVKRDVAFEVRSEVKREVANEVRENVKREVANEVRDEVKLHVRGEMKESICDELREELRYEVTRELQDSLRNAVVKRLENELSESVRENLREYLATEVKEELVEEYKSEIYLQEENKMKADLKETVRQELEPRLRMEIEKELREEITHQLQFANLTLVTSEKPLMIEKGTSVEELKLKHKTFQVEWQTSDYGAQYNEPKTPQVEKICQAQPVVMDRGTSTPKTITKEFTIQIMPLSTEVGVNPITHVTSRTFGLQTERPVIEQRHRSDQYVYMPPRFDQGTQSITANAMASTPTQASPMRADKSVFYSHFGSNSFGSQTAGDERRSQAVQVHRQIMPGRVAEVQTSQNMTLSSSGVQIQPFTKNVEIGPRTSIQQVSKESQTLRHVRDVPIQMEPGVTYQDKFTSPERDVDTSDRYVQIGPVMRDEANSPVLFPSDTKAQFAVSGTRDTVHQHSTDVNSRTVSNSAINVSQSAINTAQFSLKEDSQKTANEIVDNHPPLSPTSRKRLTTIEEEPVKLSRSSTKITKRSLVESARLDAELLNLLQQVENLNTVGNTQSKSKSTRSSLVSSSVTPQMVNVVTTILQQLPPRCGVVILQQSTAGVTYTTAILTTSTVSPTMSTGYHKSNWVGGTSTLPALFGPTRAPMLASPAGSDTDNEDKPVNSSDVSRKSKVRFADDVKDPSDKLKHTSSRYTYLSKKDHSGTKEGKHATLSTKTVELEKKALKGLTTRLDQPHGESKPQKEYPLPSIRPPLESKPGIEADVDTGDSETDSESFQASLDVKKLSPGSGVQKLLQKRNLQKYRDEMTSDSDGSSVCDQYDVTTTTGSTSTKRPSPSSLPRDRGKIKQDLSMSGVIQPKSTTTLTGYRSYDSSRVSSVSNKRSSSYLHSQKPERDTKRP
ncbi:hypothetical protein HOLleu_16556 [Holothuria leucospilota]|uniref:Uncharacterized protein n=1 Tax=Holothuria leucospilota TaxID=206669 RepID=A0A9Q1C5C7_HOLLE|nr:hypothetical protein HOLleu_16556 [Holothuria leucospilota]